MLVRIDSANSGWREYVLGTHRSRIGAQLLHGDPFLGDRICESTEYNSGQYVRFVLSFQDEISEEQAREITSDFFDLLMVGFSKEEYHHDSVFHTDSEYNHIHSRIPKFNIYTGTQLKIYNHKTDLKRLEAIKAYIVKKYNLTPTVKSLVRDPQKEEKVIQEMRAWAGQEPFVFTKKKDRDKEKMRLIDMAIDLVQSGFSTSPEDIKGEFRQMGLEIANEGFDIGKNEHYITVQNDTGKLKLMGDIFGKEFYTHSEEEKQKAIKENKSIVKEKSLDQIRKELSLLQDKRTAFVNKQYKKSRERAEKKQKELLAVAEKEALNNPIQRSEDYEEITIPEEIKSGEADRRTARSNRRSEDARRARSRSRARKASRERSVAEAIAATERRIESYLDVTDKDYRTIGERRARNKFNRRAKKSFATIIFGIADELAEVIGRAVKEVKEIFKEGEKPTIEGVLDREEFLGESETPGVKPI